MFKLTMNRLVVGLSEGIARKVSDKAYLKEIFLSIITFVVRPFQNRGASTNWCEIWYSSGDCYFPFGQGVCPNCTSKLPCPHGYRVSFAYNYTTTGCWCVTVSPTITRVCCDCTPAWNDPYKRHDLDCQCPHTL